VKKTLGKIIEFLANSMCIFAFSYVSNFIWESFHAFTLYAKHDFKSTQYIPMVSYVSMVDGFIIIGIYIFIASLWKHLLWLRDMKKAQIMTAFLTGVVIAAMVEYNRVFVSKVWSYNSVMPTIFGIGISPLFQLSITECFAFLLTRAILYQKGVYADK
jgi:hypothetical protein